MNEDDGRRHRIVIPIATSRGSGTSSAGKPREVAIVAIDHVSDSGDLKS